jgi:Lrp/AsnC family transcriptional regulator, leucine-responsive regulatory protein
MDEADALILAILQEDARMSNAEIARKTGLPASTVTERIKKLEEKKVIRGYFADIDPKALEFGLTVFVQVRTNECGGPAEQMLADIPEVLEIHDVAGEDSYWCKIRTKDTEALGRLLREKIKPIPTVIGTRTTVVLQTLKETMSLPIGEEKTESKKPTAEPKPIRFVHTPLFGQKGYKGYDD